MSELIVAGYSASEVIGMNSVDFSVCYSSFKRVQSRDRLWHLNAATATAHPDKKDENRKSMIKALEVWLPWAELKQAFSSASELSKGQLFNKGK